MTIFVASQTHLSDAARVEFHLARLDRLGLVSSPAQSDMRLVIARAAARGVRRGRLRRGVVVNLLRCIAEAVSKFR